jgi:hypothetical protein
MFHWRKHRTPQEPRNLDLRCSFASDFIIIATKASQALIFFKNIKIHENKNNKKLA